VLTDIFGGYTQDKFVYRFGLFKIDLTPRVQKAIGDFENLVKPMMDDEGFLDTSHIKSFINEAYINIPDGKYRLIDIYRRGQPLLTSIMKYLKG
jgi:hypothetical protein